MARAMKLAVEAGRLAFLAGRIPRKMYATASSPLEGLIGRRATRWAVSEEDSLGWNANSSRPTGLTTMR